MKSIKFLLTGILFGIVMSKSEAISWFRIQEMFRFQSCLMYGIIGTAVVLGVIITYLIKKYKIHNFQGNPIVFQPKKMSISRYLIGGIIFGLGWVLMGACPGRRFVNIGYSYWPIFVAIGGALMGTYLSGVLRPH